MAFWPRDKHLNEDRFPALSLTGQPTVQNTPVVYGTHEPMLYAGIATINSNAASVTVSNALLADGNCAIFLGAPQFTSLQTSGQARGLCISSMDMRSGQDVHTFTIRTGDGQPMISSSVTSVPFMIWRLS